MEGVGEAVTGGMLARAVEPEAGEEAGAAAGSCLNCGTGLAGEYCHHCGQKAHVHRTITAWWHDFVHSVLHLDGKFWRTLPMLAWRPGELTRRYVEGERARFISPLALFLFSVFLMFAVLSFAGPNLSGVRDGTEASSDIAAEMNALRQRSARLEQERRRQAAAGRATAALDARLADVRQEMRQMEMARRLVAGEPIISTNLPPGWGWVERGIKKANENPALLLYKIQTNAYKFSWALIPISVPFLWLLFLHRRRYRREHKAYDHLVFVTYSIAFMSLSMIFFFLLRSLGLHEALLGLAVMLVPPIHVYRQLKGAYRLSRFSAAWRTFVLLGFASLALTLFLLLLLAVGVLG